jgi:hypothetical protein
VLGSSAYLATATLAQTKTKYNKKTKPINLFFSQRVPPKCSKTQICDIPPGPRTPPRESNLLSLSNPLFRCSRNDNSAVNLPSSGSARQVSNLEADKLALLPTDMLARWGSNPRGRFDESRQILELSGCAPLVAMMEATDFRDGNDAPSFERLNRPGF